MKSKMSFLLIPLLFHLMPCYAQQAEKNLIKNFNLKGQTSVFLDLEGSVEVTTWNDPLLRIQMTINLQNGNETMLKSLVTAGRYNLEAKETDGKFHVIAPGLEKQIKLSNGQFLGDQVTYKVFVPKDVTVITRNSETTGQVSQKVTTF